MTWVFIVWKENIPWINTPKEKKHLSLSVLLSSPRVLHFLYFLDMQLCVFIYMNIPFSRFINKIIWPISQFHLWIVPVVTQSCYTLCGEWELEREGGEKGEERREEGKGREESRQIQTKVHIQTYTQTHINLCEVWSSRNNLQLGRLSVEEKWKIPGDEGGYFLTALLRHALNHI